MATTYSASSAGRALYRAAWEVVGQKFFDTEKLADWSSWEHRFDELIDGEETALRFIEQMLASLGDNYTRLVGFDLNNNHDAQPASPARLNTSPASAETGAPKSTNDVLVKKLPGNIGYIRIFSFENPSIVEQVTQGVEAVRSCDAFIIDLRDNGGGNVDWACSCAEFFVAKGPVGSIVRRLPDGRTWHRDVALFDEGMLFITKVTGEEERMEGFMRREPITVGKPVVVLINEHTGSSAEMMAAAIIESDKESGLVTSMGAPSFGKGIAQTTVSVLDKIAIQITCARFMSPTDVWFGDAQQTVRNPVVPDVLVPETADDGPNAQLSAAFNWLKTRIQTAA